MQPDALSPHRVLHAHALFHGSALAGIVTGDVTGTRHFELDLLAVQYNLIKSFAVDVGLDLHPKWTVI